VVTERGPESRNLLRVHAVTSSFRQSPPAFLSPDLRCPRVGAYPPVGEMALAVGGVCRPSSLGDYIEGATVPRRVCSPTDCAAIRPQHWRKAGSPYDFVKREPRNIRDRYGGDRMSLRLNLLRRSGRLLGEEGRIPERCRVFLRAPHPHPPARSRRPSFERDEADAHSHDDRGSAIGSPIRWVPEGDAAPTAAHLESRARAPPALSTKGVYGTWPMSI